MARRRHQSPAVGEPQPHRWALLSATHARAHARLASVERLWAPWRLEYVQNAGEQDGCVFCRAAASDDDEGQLVVHRGERAFVLLNKFPYASGHLLVAPYRHGLN